MTKRQTPNVEPEEQRAPPRQEKRSFADVDETSADSFPASDPPSWTSLRTGAPRDPVRRTEERHRVDGNTERASESG